MTISTTTLKNAARAIECDLWTDPSGANYLCKDGAILRRWEPLEDDGDALRLVVNLSLHVRVCRRMILVEKRELGDDCCESIVGKDPYAATRRAIVRAAAQIGATL